MLKRTKVILGSAGVVALIAVGVRVVGDPALVKFPLNIDQSLTYTGQVSLYVNPTTGARLVSPMTLPLTINRRVKVLSGDFSHAVVEETDALNFAGSTRTETYQYYMNRRTMRLVGGSKSYAFGNPAEPILADGTYRINFPLGTSASHTYLAFAPQTDSAATATPTGPAHREPVSGKQVVTFATALDHTVAPYYSAYLNRTGMPASLSAATVTADLSAAGVDVGRLASDLAPHLSSAQMSTLTRALAAPVPLTYSYFQNGLVDVVPSTGAVISASSTREGVSVTPNLSGFAAAQAVLAPYTGLSSVQTLEKAVAALSAKQVVLQMTYSETPASVRAAAAESNKQAERMALVDWQLPVGLAGVAALLLIAAAAWRPRPRPGSSPGDIEIRTEHGRKAA